MHKVEKKHSTNTNKAKSVLYSRGLRATSSVRRPSNTNSPFKNSVLSNTKNSSKKVQVSIRTNKNTYVVSKNIVSNKKIVTNTDVKNALKAKDVLFVSCAKNVLIPCHDKCLANYKLNVPLKIRRALFTTSRIVKSKFEDTTLVVSKTRFSAKTTQSKSLDTTTVVSKTNFAVVTPLSAKNKCLHVLHVVQIIMWIVDSGCSKYMTSDRLLLESFVEKFIGLGHNLFSVGQFWDSDLEVAFRSKTCYVQNQEGDDLLTGAHESNLYTISIFDMAASSPIFLMSKATSTKSWLWHRKLSHLNFSTINDLTKHDLVDGLLKFKYGKDHLCSACKWGKSKISSHPPKVVPSTHSKLELLYMDLCGPMRVASINENKYILVIVDDYSRFTWVYFLHTKDETAEIIKNFIARVHLNYNAKVHKIQTDNGTEFKNATLKAHYEKLGIMQQFSIARTPQQNGVVERRNRTLVEAARTMLIFSRLLEFLYAEKHPEGFEYIIDAPKRLWKPSMSTESMNTLSKEDLDNLFGPMYEEYFENRSSDVSINFAAQQVHNHEDSSLTYSIIVKENEAPPIVTTSKEKTSPISLNEADEFNQEDSAEFDCNCHTLTMAETQECNIVINHNTRYKIEKTTLHVHQVL
ncbi:retrovirus-related pol polyprotein from transposon TNT 1-94 [Tanacetum coccineum]|uniref:Retrovirus-related pol polyprotein from transposon TNT 1-94 n=1 Tax=Tanacetum coccineum TaxID=301880 RepID=A0ABQ5E6N8_9ASTR